MHKRGQGIQRHGVFFFPSPKPGPPQGRDMAQSPQRLGDIADPGADVSAFTTKDFELRRVRRHPQQPGLIDRLRVKQEFRV